ncbi:hypothetical protein OIZ54_15850 [Pseudoalteromonas sp. A3]|uniref:hypothetical protein n=1 Tax=unclassified Pseudoalteromonas TaxID=194690 RepID=UPI0020C0F43B|nr:MULTISPECIES: hypothetical protein [unclassified Pseudoalteromonas]MCK8095943.1 hypothetical protein [Pseudoalteromonas sp. 1CM17D]MCW1720213.1 hypothetical protein [Pseudoalteromonas sp. A3]
MKDKQSKFIRQYVRASKSPWDDSSTILLLADVIDKQALELGFTNYVYLQRDSVGSVLGISISQQLLAVNPEFSERYLEGIEMYALLLMHIEEITKFCGLFTAEFEQLFMIKPNVYFVAAEDSWLRLIESS